MVRVAKRTGLPTGAVMLVGRPVILSRPRSCNSVPPLGGKGGGGVTSAPGAAAGFAGSAAGTGGLACVVLGVTPWAKAAAARPSGNNAIKAPFTGHHPDRAP